MRMRRVVRPAAFAFKKFINIPIYLITVFPPTTYTSFGSSARGLEKVYKKTNYLRENTTISILECGIQHCPPRVSYCMVP